MKFLGTYILDATGTVPLPCADTTEWAKWYGKIANRRTALDVVGGVEVSTVFLGLDHSFDEGEPPVLWETMVFPVGEMGEVTDWGELEMRRYTTRAEALVGHKEIVEHARKILDCIGRNPPI